MGKKKVAAKTPRKKAAIKSAGSASADPSQTPLPGMEDKDVRIAAIDSSMKRLLEAKKERKALKEEVDGLNMKIAGLLEKNNLHSYKCLGKEAFLEPGSPILKIKTAKGQQ